MKDSPAPRASEDEPIAPVRILDGHGRLVCVLSATEFRRAHPGRPAIPDSAARRRHPVSGGRRLEGREQGSIV